MRTLIALLLLGSPGVVFAGSPDCTGVDRWPASMAFGYLKNAGLTDNARLDFSKTQVTRIASEKIGKDLYRQVHKVRFTERSGATIDVITVNDASSEECSLGGVEVYVIARRLGPT